MRQFFLTAMTVFLPALAFGQMMPDSTVQVCAYWSKGDRAVYECKSTRRTIDKDGIEKTTKASSETRIFDVIDETEDSYVLQTTYKDVFSSDLSLSVGAEVLNKVAEGMVIQTRTNEFGTVQDVVNLDALTEAMKKTVPLSVDAVLAKHDKKILKEMGLTRQGLIDTYTEMLCQPEIIEMTCLEDVAPLLLYHGVRLGLGEEYSYEQELRNPLPNTSGVIPVETHFWVDEELTDSTCVVIRSYFKVGSEAMMPFIRESVVNATRSFLPPDLKPEEFEEEIDRNIAETGMQATMEQFTATEIHLGSGWPTQWWSNRKIIMTSGDEKTETVEEKEVTLSEE